MKIRELFEAGDKSLRAAQTKSKTSGTPREKNPTDFLGDGKYDVAANLTSEYGAFFILHYTDKMKRRVLALLREGYRYKDAFFEVLDDHPDVQETWKHFEQKYSYMRKQGWKAIHDQARLDSKSVKESTKLTEGAVKNKMMDLADEAITAVEEDGLQRSHKKKFLDAVVEKIHDLDEDDLFGGITSKASTKEWVKDYLLELEDEEEDAEDDTETSSKKS